MSECNQGAGILIVRSTDLKILLIKRSREVSMPGYWAAPGGKIEAGEVEPEAAIRECEEELGGLPDDLWIDENPSRWNGPVVCFTTFLGSTCDPRWEPVLNWENEEWRWCDPRRLPKPLLPGTIQAIRDFLR